jgi:hypothetical protein
MKNLVIEKTFNSPHVNFNTRTGIMHIEGRSIPEDPGDFFGQIYDWIEEYFENPAELTKFEIQLDYINSGSSKYLLEFFRRIKKKYDAGNDVIVNWYYEEDDESVLELGEHYKENVEIPIKLIECD